MQGRSSHTSLAMPMQMWLLRPCTDEPRWLLRCINAVADDMVRHALVAMSDSSSMFNYAQTET